MASRPPHLTQERADRFKDKSIASAYHLRWPYPPPVFDLLVDLMIDPPRIVLDVGAGTGDLARPLAARVGRVDAVDVSAPMMASGRTLPGGEHPGLRWIEARAEEFAATSRYSLVTAGESLHWMDWDVVLPRFHGMLEPGGMLAIVQRSEEPLPWQDGLGDLISTYSTAQDYRPFDLIVELQGRGLFEVKGRHATTPVPFRQTVPNYIESFHSRSSLSRASMSSGAASAFDDRLGALIEPWSGDGFVELQTVGDIVWGLPLPRS